MTAEQIRTVVAEVEQGATDRRYAIEVIRLRQHECCGEPGRWRERTLLARALETLASMGAPEPTPDQPTPSQTTPVQPSPAIVELRTLARTLATEMQTIPLASRSWWDRHWALSDTQRALATRVVALARQAGPAPRSLATDLLTALDSPSRAERLDTLAIRLADRRYDLATQVDRLIAAGRDHADQTRRYAALGRRLATVQAARRPH